MDVARFEDWDPDGRRFDAVVAGQTWHWIDPVAGAAKAAEVLRPGGRLALFWNVMDLPPEIARAFAEVYVRIAPDLPFAPWSKAGSRCATWRSRWSPAAGSERSRRHAAARSTGSAPH